MIGIIHPFYESHRGAMEAAMRHRLDLAETMLRERAHLSDVDAIEHEVMAEFEIVLTQMPYAGGAASRMSDFFMRLTGFMAISRVPRRRGVKLSMIGEIERETLKAELLTVPEAEPLALGRQFLSLENQILLREQASKSHDQDFSEDFVYDFIDPGLGDTFEFGINYKACGFSKIRRSRDLLAKRASRMPFYAKWSATPQAAWLMPTWAAGSSSSASRGPAAENRTVSARSSCFGPGRGRSSSTASPKASGITLMPLNWPRLNCWPRSYWPTTTWRSRR